MPSSRLEIQVSGCILFAEFTTNSIKDYTWVMKKLVKFIDQSMSFEGEPIPMEEGLKLPEAEVDAAYTFAAACCLRFKSVKILKEFLLSIDELRNLN